MKYIVDIKGEIEGDYEILNELVCCKDCKHRDPESLYCDSGNLERQGCLFRVDDNYFCKYGERS